MRLQIALNWCTKFGRAVRQPHQQSDVLLKEGHRRLKRPEREHAFMDKELAMNAVMTLKWKIEKGTDQGP
jgi:hypothetical protein